MTPPRPSNRGSSAVPTARIGVDLSQLRSAPRQAREAARATQREISTAFQGAGRDAERGLNRIDSGARNAARGTTRLRNAARQLAGALGVVGGVAGAIQFGRMAIAADAAATAYRRQRVAAVNLAGSQERLNRLLSTYDEATGGAVDRATALSDVTRLMATGFADSAQELERFTRIARGISIAMGQPQSRIFSELQLAISNVSFRRLDQLGLDATEVRDRMEELRDETQGLSREMAFQQTLLEIAERDYGGLADSAEAAATGMEEATAAWKDAQLAFGNIVSGPVGGAGRFFADLLEDVEASVEEFGILGALERMRFERAGMTPAPGTPGGRLQAGAIPPERRMTGGGFTAPAFGPSASAADTPRFSSDQETLIVERQRQLDRIRQNAGQQRVEATRNHEERRTEVIRDFEQTIARDAEDFARQRARAEREFAAQIVDIRENAARREADMAEDLARANADAREATDERIADARESAQERLADLEENFQRDRERSSRQHQETILEAAARLDARAIHEEQRRFARERVDAVTAHEEQREDIQEQLQERIRDEEEALEESNRARREAHERQLREQREADERRIQDMRADFEERKRIEDEDRAIRLDRMRQDHRDQLDELDRQHAQRIQQIGRQAEDERQELDEEFQTGLDELGIRTKRWTEIQERLTERAIENFDTWWEHVNRQLTGSAFQPPSTGGATRGLPERIPEFQRGGFVPMDTVAFLHAGEFVQPAGAAGQRGGMGDINLAIYAAPGQSEEEIGNIAVRRIMSEIEGAM